VLHDTGAYYFSNPFFYNALPAPAVYGAEKNTDGSVRLDCWRERQSLDDMLAVIG
jgi:diaminopimelate decarboxylase